MNIEGAEVIERKYMVHSLCVVKNFAPVRPSFTGMIPYPILPCLEVSNLAVKLE